MKLRISCFDKTVFRKDITRFAPLWAIYLIGGLLIMLTNLAELDPQPAAQDLASTIGPFSVINLIYAALCAQLLFGDLYNSRLCNALHAMPLRRETWFITHLVSGLCFSLVPHLIGTALMLPMLSHVAVVGWIWLLGMTLEFLFFFGLAVFSAFCAGNRLAMAAVYAILNFASMIAYWFVTTIYEPLLYGVTIKDEIFALLSPVVQMAGSSKLVIFKYTDSVAYYNSWVYQGMGEGWEYLAICAGLGIVFMALALLLYRSRKLECAGDFIAVKSMEPVFAVVFTLCVGCVFAYVGDLFSHYLLFLIVGLILGWFVGQMLLRRTVRVFQWKTFLKFGILGLALGATLLVTSLDPLGITRWVPERGNVEKVEVTQGRRYYPLSSETLHITDPEEMQKVLDAHQDLLDYRYYSANGRSTPITILYTMKDGAQVTRTYTVYAKSEAWDIFQDLYDTPERILGYSHWESFVSIVEIRLEGMTLRERCKQYIAKQVDKGEVDQKDMEAEAAALHETLRASLLEALKADCEAGHLPQTMVDQNIGYKYWLELERKDGNFYKNISIYDAAVNTLAWLKEYAEMLDLPHDLYTYYDTVK